MQLNSISQYDEHSGRERQISLDEIVWHPETLRILIKQMLERLHLSPADLLRKWDNDQHRSNNDKTRRNMLSRDEFKSHVHALIASKDEYLWEEEVCRVADETFDRVCQEVRGQNFLDSIGIVHLVKWLDGPPTWVAFPVKTQQQLRQLRRRRRERITANGPTVSTRNSIQRRAREAITTASDKVRSAAAAAATVANERQQEAVTGRRNGLPPLQRWETRTPLHEIRPRVDVSLNAGTVTPHSPSVPTAFPFVEWPKSSALPLLDSRSVPSLHPLDLPWHRHPPQGRVQTRMEGSPRADALKLMRGRRLIERVAATAGKGGAQRHSSSAASLYPRNQQTFFYQESVPISARYDQWAERLGRTRSRNAAGGGINGTAPSSTRVVGGSSKFRLYRLD